MAVIVGALAGVTAGTLAQAEPGAAVEPAARVRNADRVDGKHAVSYTNKRGVRAGKLVATNRQGLLPSNIVQPYWGYIRNKPGILADHQIHWNEIVGKPAGFADGVDAGDTTYSYNAATSSQFSAGQMGYASLTYPADLALQVSLIPVSGSTIWTTARNDWPSAPVGAGDQYIHRSGNTITNWIYFTCGSATCQVTARVTVFNDGQLAPAAAKKRIEVTFEKGKAALKP